MKIEWRPISEYKRDPLLDIRSYLVKRETTYEDDDGEPYSILRYIHVASPTSQGWWVHNHGFSGMSGGGSCFYLDPPTHFCLIEGEAK